MDGHEFPVNDMLKPFLIWLIPAVPAITIHECAHGWAALCLGDPTARDAKRLTLNPVRHIDPIGTVALPALMLLAHMPFVFGWAKPVPVNFDLLRNKRIGTILVALAGPLANLMMMLFWIAVAAFSGTEEGFLQSITNNSASLFVQIALYGIGINLVLMAFNLIPIPPLDGGRVLGAILPAEISRVYMRLEKFGMLILLILVVTGLFSRIFSPVLEVFYSLLGWQ